MALGHGSVGTALAKTEWESTDGGSHVMASQSVGDMIYASTETALDKIGIGNPNEILQVNSGGTAPEWTASPKINTAITPDESDGATLGTAALEWSDLYMADGAVISLGDDDDVTLTHVHDTGLLLNSTNYFSFRDSAIFINSDADGYLQLVADTGITLKIGSTDQIELIDGAITPILTNDIDLGTSVLQFKNAYFDGAVEADSYTVEGTALDEYIQDTVGSMVDGGTETRIAVTYDDGTGKLSFVADDQSTDNDTTYAIEWVDDSDDAILRLNPSTGSDVDLTLIAGTNISLTPSGANLTIASSGVASESSTVTVTVNDSTAENNLIPYVADAATSTGAHGLEMDSGFHFNPSTNTLTVPTVAGNVTGNITGNVTGDVTGDVSGSSGSTTGNAATATALETARNIGGVSFNGTAAIDLPGVNTAGNQNTSGTAAGLSATLAVASGGTNVASYTKGDVLVASASTTLNKLAAGTDDYVLTADSSATEGVAWKEAAGGGDSFANIPVTSGKSVAIGDPIVLTSAGKCEKIDYGGPITTLLPDTDINTDSMDGKGMPEIVGGAHSMKHIYCTLNDVHVVFWLDTHYHYATDSGRSTTHEFKYKTGRYASGTWTWGATTGMPNNGDGDTYQSNTNIYQNFKAVYDYHNNKIIVAWKDADNDIHINQADITGTGTGTALSWMNTSVVTTDCDDFYDLEFAGSSGNPARVIVSYESTSGNDQHVRAVNMNTFATSTAAAGTIGSAFEWSTTNADNGNGGYFVTYNPTTQLVLLGFRTGGPTFKFGTLRIGDATTSTSFSNAFGQGSNRHWSHNYNSWSAYQMHPGYSAMFVILDEANDIYLCIGQEGYSGNYHVAVPYVFDTSITDGSYAVQHSQYDFTSTTASGNWNDNTSWNITVGNNWYGYSGAMNTTGFRDNTNSPSDRKHPTTITGHETFFVGMDTGNGSYDYSSGNLYSLGWRNTATPENGVSSGYFVGSTSATNATEMNLPTGYGGGGSGGTYGYGRWQGKPDAEIGFFGTYYSSAGSSYWVYDPDAEKHFTFGPAVYEVDSMESWRHCLAVREWQNVGTADNTTHGTPIAANGTYIGIAGSNVTNSDGTDTAKVYVLGAVAGGFSGLLPGKFYAMTDNGELRVRAAFFSLVNKIVGFALSSTEMMIKDQEEDEGDTYLYYPYAQSSTNVYTYTAPL